MYPQHYLEVIEVVLSWDLPDEAFPEAVSQQIALTHHIAGDDYDRDEIFH